MPQRTIELLVGIRQKLAPMLKEGGFPEGMAVTLTMDELWALDVAVQGFEMLVRRRVERSERREGVIAELERLHRHCEGLLMARGEE